MGDALPAQPIVPLNDSHDRRSFSCGIDALDRYFHNQAGQDQRRRIAACLVLADPERSRVAGYYTLSAYSVIGDALPEGLQKKLPKYGQIPCTLLGRLAVDNQYRNRGIGKHLLSDALQRALIHSTGIASWAVVVDAKNDAAHAFYVKYGFIPFPNVSQRLFFPMLTIADLFR